VNGIYRINIVKDTGDDDIRTYSAVLFRDKDEIARHDRFFRTSRHGFMRYPLRVTNYKPGAVYTLRVTMSGRKNGNSSGSIYLRRFKDTGIDIP